MRSDVSKTNNCSGFRSSFEVLLEDEAARGGRGGLFAKAEPAAATNLSEEGEAVLEDLGRMFRKGLGLGPEREALQVTSARRAPMSPEFQDCFAKALPHPKPARVVSIQARERPGDAAEIVAKSFDALQHDPALTPAQRGELMLGLSSVASKTFAKADDSRLRKVEAALAMLDRARAAKLSDDADPIIAKIRQAVKRGECEPADLLHLEMRLHEIHAKLKEHTRGEEQ
jgi:hypothetical protein